MKSIKSLFFLLCCLGTNTFMQGAAAPNKNFQYIIDVNGRVWRSDDPKRRFNRISPDDIVVPHGNRGKTVIWAEKNYTSITPKTQLEYITQEFDQYQKETLYASYDDLCDLISFNNARQEEIEEEYCKKTGTRKVSHIQEFYSSAAHQKAMQEIQTKSAEERIHFYNSQSSLRSLEAEYALLTYKTNHTKTQADALKKLLQKDIDLYIKTHVAIDPIAIKFKQLPEKEKDIDDLQERVDNLESSLIKRKKSLEETIKYLAAFTGNLLDKAWANVSGFLNSDGDFNTLIAKKNKLEKEIIADKQALQQHKNSLYIYTHQYEYLLSRTDHNDDLMEIFVTTKDDPELEKTIGETLESQGMIHTASTHALSKPQKDLILQSNADKDLFEQIQGDSTQNYMFRKINETLAIAAERQAKSPADKKLTAYNHATAVLCALSHEHNEQGSAIASLATHKLAQACNLASMYDAAEKGSKETLETIKNYVDSAFHYIKDRDYVDDLDQAWTAFKKNISNAITQKEVSAALTFATAASSRRIPLGGRGMRRPGGAVAITRALGEIVAREAAIAGVAIAAGGAISYHAPLLHSIDNTLKPGGGDGKKDVEWSENLHKHAARQGVPWKKIVKETNEGSKTAKYKPKTDIQKLERHAWKNGIQGDNPQGWKFMKFDEIIGASKGKETQYVVVKMKANTIHGQPISYEELKALGFARFLRGL